MLQQDHEGAAPDDDIIGALDGVELPEDDDEVGALDGVETGDDDEGDDDIVGALEGLESFLDSASLSPMEKLKLTRRIGELRDKVKQATSPIEKIRLAREVKAEIETIRARLRGVAPADPPAPPPAGSDAVPPGWSESRPGGMMTNPDPINGGIVDQNAAGLGWFFVANREGVEGGEGFASRGEAMAALQKALAASPNTSHEALKDEAPGTEEVIAGTATRRDTRALYEFNENRKPAQRKRENDAAEMLLRQIEAGEVDASTLTDAQRATLAKWSGQGGNMEDLAGTKGSAYEYFTPAPIAEGVWNVLAEMGFAGGRVLDPSCGTGVFGAMAPKNAAMECVDLSPRSARVCQILNDGPGFRTTVSSFEKVAANTPDEAFDAVVTNVPFSDSVHARGAAALDDKRYQNETMESYFLKRGMEKLRPGGLAAFLVPTRIVSSKDAKAEALRQAMSMMGEFLGAYRLPSKLFESAGAEVVTDLIVFRKHSAAAREKIEELAEQNPGLLAEALVLWPEFIQGTYFQGEGRRFVIGEFVAKDPTKFRDVDRVLHDGTAADISKLMRKLGGSRIDWAKLDAAPTQPITYNEGDTIVHAGETLQLRDGEWVSIGRAAGDEEAERELAMRGQSLETPLQAVAAGVKFAEALAYVGEMARIDRAREVPQWMQRFAGELVQCNRADLPIAWELGVTGLAVDQVQQMHADPGFNFLDAYPGLSEEMKRLSGLAKNPPKGLGKTTRECVRKLTVLFNKADGTYSPAWLGQLAQRADDRSADEKFEAAKYAAASEDGFVALDDVRQALGADFDPYTSDDWCVSADGTRVAKAGDYYVGKLGDFLRRIDAEIAAAPNDSVRAKLMRQKAMARGRCKAINFRGVQFTLSTPFLGDAEKLKFLQGFVDPRFAREVDPETGKTKYVYNGPSSKDRGDRDKLMARIAYYMNGGSISLGGAEFTIPERDALRELRRLIAAADTQIDAWAKAHPDIIGRLEKEANDPDRLYFEQDEDTDPLQIKGVHPDLKPHPYQNAYVRRMGREFNGINAFDVGLGKTKSALLAGQHALATGSKRKVVYVVPGSVLVNWRKEAIVGKGAKGDRDYNPPVFDANEAGNCLFVGLVERGGKLKTDSGAYDRDLELVRTNKHNKVFMSYEAFQRMRLREATAQAYEDHLRSVDDTFAETLNNAEENKKAGRIARLSQMLVEDAAKSASAPFFEDCGFDAVFFDEAHKLKNARVPVATKGAKYLSLPSPATVGMDASAKCWYVRKGNKRGDGVGLLTATPLTNSPAEVYSMLSLAMGDERLNHMVGARGPDAFMEAVCETAPDDTLTLDGEEKNQDYARKFVGLRNVDILRNALGQSAVVKTAADVGMVIKVPKEEPEVTTVQLDEATEGLLTEFKSAFRYAIDTVNDKSPRRGDPEALERVKALFGEPDALIAQPFNLINKMEQAALDPDLVQRVAIFRFKPEQAAKVAALVAEWNKKPPTFVCEFPNSRVTPDMIVKRKAWETDTGVKHVTLTVQARAVIEDGQVVLVGNNHKIALDFDEMAAKLGVNFEFNIPPKIAALLANFKNEEANPRGVVGDSGARRVRQIIFCDHLEVHAKLRRLLVTHCGVNPSQIAVIAGSVNGKPEEVQAVQDGFNDDGDTNKYRIVIANEKAEVGINLQIGTQAIHHLSYRGATPDGIQQRNGRGVRQGNQTGFVRVYRYDADGTFDAYKRAIIDSKASWIKAVLAKDGGNNVAISGQLSDDEYMAMVDATDKGAGGMAGVVARKEQAERLARANTSQQRQIVAAETVKSQRDWLEKNPDAMRTVRIAIADLAMLVQRVRATEARILDKKLNPDAIAGLEKKAAELREQRDALINTIEASVRFDGSKGGALELATRMLDKATEKKKAATTDDLMDLATRGGSSWKGYISVGQHGDLRELIPDGPLVNAWKAEKKVAEEMIDESGRIILKEAQANVGGFSERAHAAVMAGDFAVEGGRLWTRGTLFEYQGTLGNGYNRDSGSRIGAVVDDNKVAAIHPETGAPEWRLSIKVIAAQSADKLKVYQHGQDGWAELAARIAKLEDTYATKAAAEGRTVEQSAMPSNYVPEIAQQRTVISTIEWEKGEWLLPAPMFPLPVNPMGAGKLGVAIAADQASLIKWPNSSWASKFLAPSNAALLPRGDGMGNRAATEALLDEARRRGIGLTRADLETVSGKIDGGVLLKADRKPLADALAGAADEAELAARANAWVAESVQSGVDVAGGGWVRYAGRDATQDLLTTIATSGETVAYTAAQTAIREELRKAEQAKLDAERAAAAAEKAARDAASGTVWGWITGSNTYAFGNATKEGGIRGVLKLDDYPAAWKDKYGAVKVNDAEVAKNAPSAPPGVWITTKAGFEFLVAKYPNEARKFGLTFNPAS